MRLIGAKEFLKTVKPGTLYKRFWLDSLEECNDLISRYTNNQDLYYWGELEIFGDNGGSVGFIEHADEDPVDINGKIYNCIFYYDANVVGDASPTTTLYLVYDDESEWPESIDINDECESISKNDLIAIRDWFLMSESSNLRNELEGWALKELEENEYYKDNIIINYKGE